MKKLLTLTLPLAALLAVACDRSVAFSDTRHFDDVGWDMNDSVVFNYNADDTSQTYLCCFDIRNRNDYPFSNIYFFVKTIYPDGSLAADTNVQFTLAKPDGEWLGKRNGRYIDGRYPFCLFKFPQPGPYQFVIKHAMRDTVLQGIKDVGMVILKHQTSSATNN